jgi:hypothetical protein
MIFSKKLHWYRFEFIYKVKCRVVFTVRKTVGMKLQSQSDNHKAIKRDMCPRIIEMVVKDGHKELLRNGAFEVEPICYLGRWKND